MDSDLLDLLKSQHWEENIRELQAFLRTLVLLPFKEELLEREKLELAMMMMMIEAGQEFSLPSRLARAERSLVERAVKKLNRHKVKVAQLLGISHRAFTRKMGL
jgi:DNA-binding NtrC family response regulator